MCSAEAAAAAAAEQRFLMKNSRRAQERETRAPDSRLRVACACACVCSFFLSHMRARAARLPSSCNPFPLASLVLSSERRGKLIKKNCFTAHHVIKIHSLFLSHDGGKEWVRVSKQYTLRRMQGASPRKSGSTVSVVSPFCLSSLISLQPASSLAP